MLLFTERRGRGQLAAASASIALALIAMLAVAGSAQAAETIYWDNYGADPQGIAYASIDGSGGGALNLTGGSLETPEGMAYDTVSNRLFVGSENGSEANDHILYVKLDGTGAGALNTGGAPVDAPEGVAVDPATRIIYWVNTGDNDSIGWANIDTGQGGLLNTSGATVDNPYKLAIDPVGGRVYWVNASGIGYANANNTGGGGNLNLTGAPPVDGSIRGIVTDPAGGRVYWLDAADERVGYASLAPGGNGGEINLADASFDGPYGLAFDPSLSRLYWANYSQNTERSNVIGTSTLSSAFGGITIASAPLDGPQDPVVLKSPTGTAPPVITRNAKIRSELSCSAGGWAADYAGSFVYQAPRTFTYQWTVNGAVLGSGPEIIGASKAGSYACTVTATNQTGSATQTSGVVKVKATKVKLSTKKKGSGEPGKAVSFKVKAVNQGDIGTRSSAKVCVKLPQAAKADLKQPKCKKLGPLKGRAKKTINFRVKVKPGADEGTDKLTFQVKGAPGKAAKSKIHVK